MLGGTIYMFPEAGGAGRGGGGTGYAVRGLAPVGWLGTGPG